MNFVDMVLRDTEFVDMLNSIRLGILDRKIVIGLRKLSRALHYSDGIEPTEL